MYHRALDMGGTVAPAYAVWKLFERTPDGRPRSLVHAFPSGPPIDGVGQLTRYFHVGKLLEKRPYTKGFNFFLSREAAIRYLPRFRVRAPNLVLCRVFTPAIHMHGRAKGSVYALGDHIYIDPQDWSQAVSGASLLSPSSNP
jgi:hypothetical protein